MILFCTITALVCTAYLIYLMIEHQHRCRSLINTPSRIAAIFSAVWLFIFVHKSMYWKLQAAMVVPASTPWLIRASLYGIDVAWYMCNIYLIEKATEYLERNAC